MSDQWGYDETDDQLQNANGPKPLRDAYKAQKERADKLEERLAAMEAVVSRNTVADLIESQGVARAAAKYYSGDADPEKVTSWVNDMRTTFGGASAPTATPAQPVLSSDDQNRLQSLMQAGADGATPGNFDAAMNAMNDATSTADRVAAFENFMRTARG